MHSAMQIYHSHLKSDLTASERIQYPHTGTGTEDLVVVLLSVDQFQLVHLFFCL